MSEKRLRRELLDEFSSILDDMRKLERKIPGHCAWVVEGIEGAAIALTKVMISVDSVTRGQRK